MPPKVYLHVRLKHLGHVGGGTPAPTGNYLLVANGALAPKMETQLRNKRKGPLPGGDRRGTSGADAGRLSMQTVSDSLLSRRARVGEPECITADQRGGEGTDDVLRSRASPSEHSAGTSVSTTSNISNDKRRKWSNEELEELMFCFYKAQSEGPGYIGKLMQLFSDRNPDNPKIHRFNGNTLSNQARRILKQNIISREVLDRIKRQAEEIENTENTEQIEDQVVTIENNTQLDTLQLTDTQNSLEPIATQITQYTSTELENIDQLTSNITVTDEQDPLILDLLRTLAETKEIPITDRYLLPKAKINKQFIENLHKVNEFLPNLLATNNSLRETNDIIYAAAKTLIVNNNQAPFIPKAVIKPKTDPPWKRRIRDKIEKYRKETGRLIEIEKGVSSRKMLKHRDKLYVKYNIHNDNDLKNQIEILTQKIKALAARIKRYEDMNKKKEQNRLFHENEHKLYRSLGSDNSTSDIKLPSQENVEEFWRSILSTPVHFNKDAKWIDEEVTTSEEITETNIEEITEEQVKAAIRRLHNWKTPGIDKIQNYYLKYFTSIHSHLASMFTRIVKGTESIEDWFTTGQVILIPKNENTEDPKNWRPIACLPSTYKLLTSVLANQLYKHCHENNIMAEEQRGCRRGARGCKDHLMVNKAILEDAHQSQKNLSMAWIDYRKAFDSISHEWLLKILDIYKCPPMIKSFLLSAMPLWRVIMTARGSRDSITTEPIYIRRGIFQGDSLSPLLFCLAINPISSILNKYELKGYKLKDSIWINHLLYMDDLKIYANHDHNLKVLINSVEIFTNDIGMSFGLDKCNVLHLKAGHRSNTLGEGHILLSGETFTHLAIGDTYKYLGVHESGKIEHSQVREQTTKEYFKRVKKLLNTHLNARNIIKGINTYAIPVLLYSFGIINYKMNDLKKIDIKTRKLLNIKKAHQQKADVERLYLPVTEGGRGLINAENMYKTQILKYKQYLSKENDHLIKTIAQHDRHRHKYSIFNDAEEIETEIGLSRNQIHKDKEIKEAIVKVQNTKWRNKPLHGQFPKVVLDQANIDRELSFKWIKQQSVSPSLESSIFAIQDQAVVTRQHERDILKRPVDGKCRLCLVKDETTQHIISGCEKLAGTYYTKRHNNIVQYVYWSLAKKHNLPVSSMWWQEHLLEPQVRENDSTKIMWEIPIQTDVTITHNRPDIVYVNKIENKTYLIDITVPSDYNIGAKEIEKLSKYHALKVELTRLWKRPTEIIPIVVGATGVIAKSLDRYCNKLDANINKNIIQKQAAIHTVTIISKVLGDTVFVNNPDTQQTTTTQQIHDTQRTTDTQPSPTIQQTSEVPVYTRPRRLRININNNNR